MTLYLDIILDKKYTYMKLFDGLTFFCLIKLKKTTVPSDSERGDNPKLEVLKNISVLDYEYFQWLLIYLSILLYRNDVDENQ